MQVRRNTAFTITLDSDEAHDMLDMLNKVLEAANEREEDATFASDLYDLLDQAIEENAN